jgi:cobalt-zinc-cadmium efflux system membrane fusion protein
MKNEVCRALPVTAGRGRVARVWIGAVLALGAAFVLAGCAEPAGEAAAATTTTARNVTLSAAQRQRIRVYTVAASNFHQTVATTGTVDFDNDRATSVLAPFSGPVSRVLVAVGDKVNRGQALALVDSADFAAAIGSYRKALVTARNARRLADMDQDLLRHEGIAQREATQAQTDAASAEADRDAALQALVALHVDAKAIKAIQAGRPVELAQGTIRAPIAGTVVEKLISPGQLLQAGTTPCFTVANLSRMWVMAQVSGSDLASVRVGDTAEVETGSGAPNLRGTVDNISALVNPDTRAVVARVVVDNPAGVLRKQMYVNVLVHSRQARSGLLVPVSAILRDDENLPFVYVVQRDGSYARQRVTTGYRAGDQVDVAAGLRVGDRVVVDGGIFVQFMQNQ